MNKALGLLHYFVVSNECMLHQGLRNDLDFYVSVDVISILKGHPVEPSAIPKNRKSI